jgi:hypothetical protein
MSRPRTLFPRHHLSYSPPPPTAPSRIEEATGHGPTSLTATHVSPRAQWTPRLRVPAGPARRITSAATMAPRARETASQRPSLRARLGDGHIERARFRSLPTSAAGILHQPRSSWGRIDVAHTSSTTAGVLSLRRRRLPQPSHHRLHPLRQSPDGPARRRPCTSFARPACRAGGCVRWRRACRASGRRPESRPRRRRPPVST